MTKFEIHQLEMDARREIVCTGCYGSGGDRWDEGKACSRCSGRGRAVAEPAVLKVIELLRTREAELVEAQYKQAHIVDTDRLVESLGDRVIALEDAIKNFLDQYPWKDAPEIRKLDELITNIEAHLEVKP